MKAKFLEIAGVKTEEEFYKKYPTEKAFMAKCGAKLRKAYPGITFDAPEADNIFQNGTFQQPQTNNLNSLQQGIGQGFSALSQGIQGFRAIGAEKEAVNSSEQMKQVSGMALKAKRSDRSNEEVVERRMDRYVRPEDYYMTGEELFPIHGVGTNVLAKDGKKLNKANNGSMIAGQAANIFGQFTNNIHGNSGGAQIGKGIGTAIGIANPIAGAIATPILGLMGDELFGSAKRRRKIERNQDAIEHNVNSMAGMDFGSQIRKNFSPNMEDGGMMKGQVQPLWGGNVKTTSYNPFSPGTGETAMITGKSHEQGGVGLKYGDNVVEAEGGEPIVELEDGGNMSTVAIMGNLHVPQGFKDAAEQITGEKMKGNKFKTFTKNISKMENKHNKAVERNVEKAGNYTPLNKLDRVSLNTLKLNLDQIHTPKLAALQDVKEGAAALQEILNDSGAGSAKNGKIMKYRKGGTPPNGGAAKSYVPVSKNKSGLFGDVTPEDVEAFKDRSSLWFDFDGFDATNPEDVERLQIEYNKKAPPGKQVKVDGKFGPQTESMLLSLPVEGYKFENLVGMNATSPKITPFANTQEISDSSSPKGDFPWMTALGQVPQLFRNTDAEPFDYRQTIPEMWALSNNQLEAVDAQKYNPRLDVPYDISLQDQVNEVTAGERSAMRMAQYKPELAGNIMAQSVQAKNRVLGEQFRANQANKERVYSNNRNILNDADMKNLGIMDQQYVRQAQAKSNTKATNLEALKSITDKVSKHALENKTLRIWENMYNYRYDPQGRSYYTGPPADFSNWQVVSNQDYQDSDKFEYYRGPDGKTYRRERSAKSNYPPGLGAARALEMFGKTPGFNPSAKKGAMLKKYKNY